ncbi:unnamed protein product [marine sediment metagenome]|uniref:Uncharacterized protein n=1 Tax=marine sediment metagenome TaxID=412755 RepID=X1GH19_9ZZZZ
MNEESIILSAAQTLGFKVVDDYQQIGEIFNRTIIVEGVKKTFTFPQDKQQKLTTYNDQISRLDAQKTDIQEEIDKINAV